MPAQTRGFLFSDLRGYSAFTEREGDRAARALLTTYRRVVREAIASFRGAEIRTEGDSFYVVFASVSDAVEAGLAVLAGLRSAEVDAGQPIAVGIGVHAGEVEDTEDGIVSSAVNIAARICAVAAPGELLVSETVRSLTRTYLDVAFQPRGRRRLKGIREPIAVYRVVAKGAPAPTRRRWRKSAAIVGVVAAAVAVLVGGAALGLRLPGGVGSGDAALTPPVLRPSAVAATRSSTAHESVEAAANISLTDAHVANLEFVAPSRRDRCEPALPEDGPRFRDGQGLAANDPAPLAFMTTYGGIHCAASRLGDPTSIWIWELGQLVNPSAPANAVEWMASHAAQVGAAPGVCSPESVPALESWTFSGRSGQLLCFTSVTGDAIVYWTYQGQDVLGKAVRDDKDMAQLLEWWRTEARVVDG